MSETLASLFVRSIGPTRSDVLTSVERMRRATDVHHVAVMPDAHLSSDVCVGVVIATRQLVYPAAVGSDIGCGMAAVAIDSGAHLLCHESAAGRLLASLSVQVPAIKHRARRALPASLENNGLTDPRLEKLAQRDGCVQMGTLGRGNHFLEFQAAEDGRLWVMVHSGSRAMGQAITAHHVRKAEGRSSGLSFLSADSPAGRAYLADVQWARTYAAENRLSMLRAVEAILTMEFSVTLDWSSLIHSDHDHVERERHFGEDLLVHRKGAQSAKPGEAGIIPGSMGTATFHVAGRGLSESMSSCAHGAGRRLTRTRARQEIGLRQLQRELGQLWCDRRRLNQLRDEAPSAYQDIEKVMQAQRDLVRVVRRLRPLLSYKRM